MTNAPHDPTPLQALYAAIVDDGDAEDYWGVPELPNVAGTKTRLIGYHHEQGRDLGPLLRTPEEIGDALAHAIALAPLATEVHALATAAAHLGDDCTIEHGWPDEQRNTFRVRFADGCILYAIASELAID